MNKQEIIKALREDAKFREDVQKAMGVVPTNAPFPRNLEEEERKIKIAIEELDYAALKLVAESLKNSHEEFDGSIYANEELCKDNITDQLRASFDILFTNYPNVTVDNTEFGESYSVTMDGAFFTIAEYYKRDDGTWEPAVSVRFCPVEYFEY